MERKTSQIRLIQKSNTNQVNIIENKQIEFLKYYSRFLHKSPYEIHLNPFSQRIHVDLMDRHNFFSNNIAYFRT